MRESFLRNIYKIFPFDLRGDCVIPPAGSGIRISCVINFYGRLDLLNGILFSLCQQDFPRDSFEVILVEDRGGTAAGREMAERFSRLLPIVYAPLDKHFGSMGYSRNFGLSHCRGEIILFLDDDTVILQSDFLSTLGHVFHLDPSVDAVVPRGSSAFSLVQDRYAYHDEFFMTSRCTAYRRNVLSELGGFIDDFVGQEDVEFVVRFKMSDRKAVTAPELRYYHPPLLVPNFRKPQAVGSSFYRLKRRYPLAIWLLLLLNCGRHAPLYLLPGRRNREMGRFGVGFIGGVIASVLKKEGFQYS